MDLRPPRFSRQGSLLATAEALVRAAPTGCVAAELDAHLGVRSAAALHTLIGAGRLSRAKVGGCFLDCASEPDRKVAQVTARRLVLALPRRALPAPTLRDLPTPLSGPVVLFVSLLNEQQRRLFAGLESLRYGPGGDSQTSAALGLDRGTVAHGRRELLARDIQRSRVRRPDGGRKALEKNPALTARLQELLAPDTAGDPMGHKLNWCRRTPGKLAEALGADGQTISARTVGHLLKARGYSLRVNRKALASTSHPRCDDRFQHSARLRAQCQAAGAPIVSVDSKKKELIGRFWNAGAKWNCTPEEVLDHDFPSDADGRAVPYGILDLQANPGFVGVGSSADTAAFAVDWLALWWRPSGRRR